MLNFLLATPFCPRRRRRVDVGVSLRHRYSGPLEKEIKIHQGADRASGILLNGDAATRLSCNMCRYIVYQGKVATGNLLIHMKYIPYVVAPSTLPDGTHM